MTERSAPKRLSPSAADTYADCPAKWEAKYLLNAQEESGEDAEVGTLSHAVLEGLFKLPAERRTLEEARKLLAQVGTQQPTTRQRLAWGYVATAMKMEDPTQVRVLGNEVRVRGVEVAGVPFTGIIDRVEEDFLGGVRVVDYKTGKRPAPQFMEPKRRQVTLYALGWEATGGGRVDTAALMWLKAKKLDEVSLDETRESTSIWFSDQWAGIKRDLAAGHFEPNPGPLCGWCPALETCEVGRLEVRARMEAGKNVGPGADLIFAEDLAASVGQGLRVIEGGAA